MGCYWTNTHPNDFYPSGLAPDEVASVTRVLEPERWSIAEERTRELITCIQPNQLSEERRNAVASYVQQLITSCISCQVFRFGSVPLKTYLPDGDIDLTAFGNNESSKDTWANEVRDMLMSEEKNENAEFCVKEVQYIQAEVKLIKCLVDDIVVDISFNQLGGLCTLCFLEEVDSLVSQNHLFKRSIILIKAWCYYESRILGAHHGLISTYALETLVLYIFHVFNNSFAGPLEVLYRFLEFFSKFDWDNLCVGLWGPVPIRSLPDMKADPPRKDGGELLLSKLFLDACTSVYSAFPIGQENHELPFMSKHFNVIDPLRANNNLGRSVSKGNFFRIRSAFAFGAQRLARLLDCPKENIVAEVNQFFMNTLDRHGKQLLNDVPKLLTVNTNCIQKSNNLGNSSSNKKVKENFASNESEVEMTSASLASHSALSQHGNQLLKRVSRPNTPTSAFSNTQSQNKYPSNSSMASDLNRESKHSTNSNAKTHAFNSRSSRPDRSVHGRYQFARTHSSPELTDTSRQISTQGRHNKASETLEQTATGLDYDDRMNLAMEVSENSNAISLTEDLPASRHHWIHAPVESNGDLYGYHGESGFGHIGDDRISAAEAMRLEQEEQDFVNMMAASTVPSYNGHVHRPFNFASGHLPIPLSPSILASLGYVHRNSSGVSPANISSYEVPWGGTNMHYSQGLVSLPIPQYFSNMGLASNQEEILETIDDNLVNRETHQGDSDHGLSSEPDVDSVRGSDVNSGSFLVQPSVEKKILTPLGYHIPSSPVNSLESYPTKAHMSFNDDGGSIRADSGDKFVPPSLATSRMKQSSEDSFDGSSMKTSRSTRDRRGRKSAPFVDRSALYENGGQYDSESVDYVSSKNNDENGDWSPPSTVHREVSEITSSILQTHEVPGYKPAQLSGSKPMFPIAPVFVHPGSSQCFYPTGPPIPFVTMLPFYNYPPEKATFDSSTNHFDQRLDSPENLDEPEIPVSSSSAKRDTLDEPTEEHTSDILNGDFPSHWLNLQHGRLCQNPGDHGTPMHYPSSPVVPPMYTQRPLSANANLFSQLMGYGSRMIPVPSLQPGTNRPLSGHGHYGDEIRRGRNGTGTYLPNPKMSFREKHSSNGRNKGNYGYDRYDQSGDREGNWNANSKHRFGGRGRGRNQFEKQNVRVDRTTANNSRFERPDSFPANQSHNSSIHSVNSMHSGSSNGAYGMYPLPVMNPNGVSPGTTGPPVFMLYPCAQNLASGSSTEHLEFGSLGTVHFPGVNEVQLGEGSSKSINVQQNLRVDSAESSPDMPSSPNLQR
ncbi:hypothetical protein Vadar_009007 [Vaccinium darrowii]|uniref:Uncharacterized protein n=1 Tax=Vaccinium darrowii TaxID=229202 RepID=A0ACB7YKD9_9ERIC|nr:hypothetical protein Vadar_009007 [Vaccinium darrowii]